MDRIKCDLSINGMSRIIVGLKKNDLMFLWVLAVYWAIFEKRDLI